MLIPLPDCLIFYLRVAALFSVFVFALVSYSVDPIGQPHSTSLSLPAQPYPIKGILCHFYYFNIQGWVFDLTHDNQPIHPENDCLPLTAAISMSNSITGMLLVNYYFRLQLRVDSRFR